MSAGFALICLLAHSSIYTYIVYIMYRKAGLAGIAANSALVYIYIYIYIYIAVKTQQSYTIYLYNITLYIYIYIERECQLDYLFKQLYIQGVLSILTIFKLL